MDQNIFTDFDELHGDRLFGDDQAIIGGPAKFKGQPVVIIGHEKGDDTKSRIQHNFGMARPEGYRKAARLMDLADKFNLPVITFIDTPGAYPGKGAEERGQAEAIAKEIDPLIADTKKLKLFLNQAFFDQFSCHLFSQENQSLQ